MRSTKNSQILENNLSKEGILRLTLNDPTNLNALSENMMDLFQDQLSVLLLNHILLVNILKESN